MAFEKYESKMGSRNTARLSDNAKPLIWAGDVSREAPTIMLNWEVMRLLGVTTKSVSLYFDEVNDRLGIEPAEPGTGGSLSLQKPRNGKSNANIHRINAQGFMSRFPRLRQLKDAVWEMRLDNRTGMIVGELVRRSTL